MKLNKLFEGQDIVKNMATHIDSLEEQLEKAKQTEDLLRNIFQEAKVEKFTKDSKVIRLHTIYPEDKPFEAVLAWIEKNMPELMEEEEKDNE